MKIFEWITSFFAWLEIVASPLIVGFVIAFIIYYNYSSTAGLIVSIIVALLGLAIGVIWATRIWKRKGTVNFISRISATPELDNLDSEE